MVVHKDSVKLKKYEEFLKRHMIINNSLNDQQIDYKIEDLLELCQDALDVIKRDEMLATISPPVVVVGDIHGQYFDLLRLFSLFNQNSIHGVFTMKYVFLGDYVDRGSRSLECISLLFTLKILFPTKYLLVRGNHETRNVNRFYGFYDEVLSRFTDENKARTIWLAFNEVFDWMPIAGLIGKKILCMHGGISSELNSLQDIRKLQRPLEDPNTNNLALDILWADPAPNYKGFGKNLNRGISCVFGDDVVKEICKKLKISLIVRAHQVMMGGYSFFAQKHLVTIFSAPRYQSEWNRAAVMVINKDGKYKFKLLNPIDTLTKEGSKLLITQADSTPTASLNLTQTQNSSSSQTKEK
ncbi:unnamed protein product [Auanema sp. JU1783]|nr:unnamed protein product [Auanema sp. JU1783]